MRAYISFILIFASLLVLFSVFGLTLYQIDKSRAITELRIYSFSMNMKELSLELLRQGAMEGFREYDESHDISLCKHCADNACMPPPALNYCDPSLCDRCFRESDARTSAEQKALQNTGFLKPNQDFDISFSEIRISTFTAADPAMKNMFRLSNLRIEDDIFLEISSDKFDVYGKSKIPRGVIVDCEQH